MATTAIVLGVCFLLLFPRTWLDHDDASRRFGRVDVWLLALVVIGLCLLSLVLWMARPDLPQTGAQPNGASQQRDMARSSVVEGLSAVAEPTRSLASRDDIFTVLVRDPLGIPVAGAELSVSEQQPAVRRHSALMEAVGLEVRRLHATTRSDGIAPVPIPDWAAANVPSTIVVRRIGFQPYAGDMEWGALRAEVTLYPGFALTGRAVLHDGRPPRDARAFLYAVGEDAQPVVRASVSVADLDAQGGFIFTDLRDCEYEVIVKCAGYCMSPMDKRRFRPGGESVTVTMLPVLGCRIQMISHDGMTMVLPHGTMKRIVGPVSLDYSMNLALASLYDLTPLAKALLESGELLAGIALNAKPGQDFSAHVAKLVLDAPSGCVAGAEFSCFMTDLDHAVANPHFFTIEPEAGWVATRLQTTSRFRWMEGELIGLGVQCGTDTLYYHLPVGEVVGVVVPSGSCSAHVTYDAFSERKLLGNVFSGHNSDLAFVDATPDRVLELIVRSTSGEALASWMIGELRGSEAGNAHVCLRNVAVLGRNHFRFVNYPKGSYEVVVIAGKVRVRVLFDGQRSEESIVIGL